eukprot:5465687-Pleurochrysis_carterae.AAC.1
MLVRALLIFRPSASALQPSSSMPWHPTCKQLDWQSFTACLCRGASNDGQTHDQHIGNCVWPCKQRCLPERVMLVRVWLVFRTSASALHPSTLMPTHPACKQLDWQSFTANLCRGASNDGQAHDQHIGNCVWPCKQ